MKSPIIKQHYLTPNQWCQRLDILHVYSYEVKRIQCPKTISSFFKFTCNLLDEQDYSLLSINKQFAAESKQIVSDPTAPQGAVSSLTTLFAHAIPGWVIWF